MTDRVPQIGQQPGSIPAAGVFDARPNAPPRGPVRPPLKQTPPPPGKREGIGRAGTSRTAGHKRPKWTKGLERATQEYAARLKHWQQLPYPDIAT